MSFRTVLTIAGLAQDESALQQAAALCEEAHAHLSVLVMALAAPPPVGEYAAVLSDAWMQERQADLEQLKASEEAVSRCLAKTALSADVARDYPELAWADEVIGRRGRYADITVVWPDLPFDDISRNKAIEGALFSSGKPLLLVPEGWRATFGPKRVMIAWDSRLEATRAVRESVDMLQGADEVRLVLVDPVESENGHGAEPGADAAAFLARHGAKVTVDRLPSQGHTVAEILRRHAVDCATDLVVMGAYGHSRMRERIFGGVTKSMLEEPPVPILMAR
ncbi:universal stress protein [Chelativorans sp. AA-79]|uniref:universal stress protein n=1 Tax=Chelativorans sp. AA-79 TaxID=3028735 RepID=UPI0023F62971|nr:universal stress protein [Chelativorans sp. AA-79]WEX10727.1 universal stress protein [Chelativorans sp. AA-79]